MASSIGTCAVCGQSAKLRCSRCTEGLNVDGEPSPTYYCINTCQKADWSKHKITRKSANARKQLYRGGKLVQKVFYAYREAAFDLKIKDIKAKGDKLHIYDDKFDWKEDPLFPFPNDLVMNEKDKAAIVMNMACTDAVAYMHELFKKVFAGESVERNCEPRFRLTQILLGIIGKGEQPKEVVHRVQKKRWRIIRTEGDGKITKVDFVHQAVFVRITDNNLYVLDPAGAQYCQHDAVLPFSRYKKEYVAEVWESKDFGWTAAHQKELVEGKHDRMLQPNTDMRMLQLHGHNIEWLNASVLEWEVKNQMTVAQMLRGKRDDFQTNKQALFTYVMDDTRQYIESSKKYRLEHGIIGGPDGEAEENEKQEEVKRAKDIEDNGAGSERESEATDGDDGVWSDDADEHSGFGEQVLNKVPKETREWLKGHTDRGAEVHIF